MTGRSLKFKAILELCHIATDKIQGLIRPEESWMMIKKLYDIFSNLNYMYLIPNTVKIQAGERIITKTGCLYCNLNESVKETIILLVEELERRFIRKGPPRCALICIYLNPDIDAKLLLDSTQLEAINLHAKFALKKAATSLNIVLLESSPVQKQRNDISLLDDFSCYSSKATTLSLASAVDASTTHNAIDLEMDALSNLNALDFSKGVCNGKFDPSIFYASPYIVHRFPMHALVAKCNYSAILHEATSERTFSDCGRFIGDLRSSLSSEYVCAQVISNAGERNFKIEPAEIKKHYQSKRKFLLSHEE